MMRIEKSPLFPKIVIFPYFRIIYKLIFPSIFVQFTCFLLPNLRFCFPYFDHDAFMHQALRVG